MKVNEILKKLGELELKKIIQWYGIIVLGILGVTIVFSLAFFLPWFISAPSLLLISGLAAVIYSI